MLNNFIYAKKKALFLKALNNNEVLDEAIVFIEDTKEIWNHGTYFCGKSVDISNIEESINSILNTKLDTITDLEVIRQGAAKGATALQSYTEQYKGTVTGVKVNGTTNNPTNGIVDLGTIAEGNPNANIEAIETADLQIDDISVNRQIINTTDTDITLINNNYYKKTDVSSSITINLEPVENNTVTNYCIEFTTSSSGTAVALPSTIKWLNCIAPIFENDCTYQISIVNNLGVCAKFA